MRLLQLSLNDAKLRFPAGAVLETWFALKATAYILGHCISLPFGQLNAANAADPQSAV